MKKIIALLLAVLMVAGVFAGCSSKKDVPTLVWYQVGGGKPANYDSWAKTFNEYVEEKIGVNVKIECVSWGDWGNRRNVIVQTNEPYDLMFTDMGSYASDVAMGAFADITDLLDQVPELKKVVTEQFRQGCMIDGKLYAIPAVKDSSMTNYFVWTKEHVDAYFPDYANYHTLSELTSGMEAIKEGTGIAPLLLAKDGMSAITGNKYDAMGLGSCGVGVSYTAEGAPKVVPVFEQEDVLTDLEVLHQWMNDGLINSDAAILDVASGMCSMGIAQGWPSAAKGWGDGRGAEVVVSQFEDTVLSNDTIQGSMTCIANSSKYKLEALKFLELVNTDTKVRDMLAYGEEGVNFEYVEENGQKRVKKLNTDWTFAGYTQGTFFNMTLEAGAATNYWVEEVQVQNNNATVSPALGFYCDTAEIKDEIAACKAIYEGYKAMLMTGTGEPRATAAAMMVEMRDAGFDKIVTEVQTQLDAWYASK